MDNKEHPILKPDVKAAHSKVSFEKVVPSHVNDEEVVEEVQEEIVTNKNGKKVRSRQVHRRNIFLSILFTLLTHLYGAFWVFEIDKETKAISKNKKGATSALVLVLFVVTLGIYAFFWVFRIGKKQCEYYLRNGIKKPKLHVRYLLILLIAWIVSCASIPVAFAVTNFANNITTILIVLAGSLVFIILGFLVLAMMQYHNNRMLEICTAQGRDKVLCRDSSIFNRPFWSSLLLLLVGLQIPGYVTTELTKLMKGNYALPTDPSNLVDNMIRESANQVANAGDLTYIIPGICTILSAIFVLWWFALRFKHSKYPGVLNIKNFGKALVLCLPAFVICITNCFGFFAGQVPEFQRGALWVVGVIILGFIPGFTEEMAFRGMLVPNLIRIFNRKSGIWLALFVTSAIFGLVHFGNTLFGADVGISLFQVFYAFALGMTFAAVLIRTGNLWASIICHGCIDTLAFLSPEALRQGAIQTQGFSLEFDTIILIVWSIVLIAYGIWLCRPKKHNEILELWRCQFGDAMLQPIDK